MSTKNRVKLKICGSEYIISTEDSEAYVRTIGSRVNDHIHKIMESSPAMSTSMAAVFAALDFCDEASKASDAADNLRAQIKDYLEDSAQARAEAASAKAELDAAKKTIASLRIEAEECRHREDGLYKQLQELKAKTGGLKDYRR